MAAGKRFAVRSGGHCAEAFVSAPENEVIIDLSSMAAVEFDRKHGAFMIEPGATLGQVYRILYQNWGVTIPAGFCVGVGAGGHICGGGYGALARQFGLSADHLYAVEVVVVNKRGAVSAVVATRDEQDPNRELWWAHTGGGGGNFGIVTRYWLRSPEVRGTKPDDLLPSPPSSLNFAELTWSWQELDQRAFTTLVRNFNGWHLRNSAVDSPYVGLTAYLTCAHQASGGVTLTVHVAAEAVNADRTLDTFVEDATAGVGGAPSVKRQTLPWLAATRYLSPPDAGTGSVGIRRKVKAADLRGAHTDQQIATAYRYLTSPDYTGFGSLEYVGYGGKVNAVAPDATATVHRSTLVKTFYSAAWEDAAADEKHMRWIQEFYRDMHAETGGVPVPDETNAGSFINYPDIDLADLEWNKSGVPWYTFYYGENYPRLQRIKARWDPKDLFRHTLSIRPS
ncbi:BBE domain-containing protein [Amycolatopsis azurea]|uniref:BBE domain-containing protein n=1 Tax=Amycolatopsis azurea TaxID=36819 RepID=UPI0037FD91EE